MIPFTIIKVRKLGFTSLIILTMIIILNNVIQLPLLNAQNNANVGNKLSTKEIECDSEEHFDFHIHTKLVIMIDNHIYPIPADIGIIPEMYLLVTYT